MMTDEYKYLGVPIDSSLNMNTFFNKCYKKASSRLNRLAKIRNDLDITSVKATYQSMILPTFTYCGLQLLLLTETQTKQLEAFHQRALRIVNANDKNPVSLRSIINANKKRCEYQQMNSHVKLLILLLFVVLSHFLNESSVLFFLCSSTAKFGESWDFPVN